MPSPAHVGAGFVGGDASYSVANVSYSVNPVPEGSCMYGLLILHKCTLISPAAGWTEIDSGDIGVDSHYEFYKKIAGPSEDDEVYFFITDDPDGWWGFLATATDADGETPIVGAVQTATSEPCTAPPPATSNYGYNLCMFVGGIADGGVWDCAVLGGEGVAGSAVTAESEWIAGTAGYYSDYPEVQVANTATGYDNVGVQIHFPATDPNPPVETVTFTFDDLIFPQKFYLNDSIRALEHMK